MDLEPEVVEAVHSAEHIAEDDLESEPASSVQQMTAQSPSSQTSSGSVVQEFSTTSESLRTEDVPRRRRSYSQTSDNVESETEERQVESVISQVFQTNSETRDQRISDL